MKLSRIKKLCMNEKTIRLYSVQAPSNAVMQWLGTDKALYAVEGGMLTLAMLKQLWEISPEKETKFDLADDTLEGAVERKLLAADDIVYLSAIPAMIDTANAPKLGLAEINGYKAIAAAADRVTFAEERLFEPCYGKWDTTFEVHMDGELGTTWVAVYTDGTISGMIRATNDLTTTWLHKVVKAIAGREPSSRTGADE